MEGQTIVHEQHDPDGDGVAEHAVTTVTEPVGNVVAAVDNATNDDIEAVRHLLELHGTKLDANTSSIQEILGHLSTISNNLTSAAAAVTEAATNTAGETAEAVLTIPEVPAEAADDVVHVATHKRGRVGPRRR